MCRCQVSRAAFGSARSVGARQRGCTRAPAAQACGNSGLNQPRFPTYLLTYLLSYLLARQALRKKKNQSTVQELATHPLNVTRCGTVSCSLTRPAVIFSSLRVPAQFDVPARNCLQPLVVELMSRDCVCHFGRESQS